MKNRFILPLFKGLYELWYWHYKNKYKLKKSEFNVILHALINEYKNQIINNSHGVVLDYNLGELASEWVKPKRLKRDGTTYLNLATNFKTIKVRYKLLKARKRNKYINMVSFKASSSLRRELSKSCVENTEIYKNARTTNK